MIHAKRKTQVAKLNLKLQCQIKFKTLMLKSSLCDAYILVKGRIARNGARDDVAE